MLILKVVPGFSQRNHVAIFDLTAKNAETTNGNLFSVEHLLKVSGLPYTITTDFSVAAQSKLIVFTSNIETTTFTSDEITTIQNFVTGGGVVIATQLKDSRLFNVFGVSGYSYGTRRFSFNFLPATEPGVFRWIDDPNEKHILLGDSSRNTDIIGTRAYTLTTASQLGTFGEGTTGFSKNKFGDGYAYLLGISWRDVVLRNQVIASFNAFRTYSNGFEPGTDVFMLILKGIYTTHNVFSVWKHTSGLDSKASLIITHDVDATSAIKDMMNNFAAYELENGIRATYFVTTHYMHDSLAKDFWNGYTNDINALKTRHHEIASHSVSHVPDFDNETVISEGSEGNTELTYAPFYNGHFSNNVTVHGETEVSKSLLERATGLTIRSYRTGYLLYHEKLLNILAGKNYVFNSSLSANNVLTAFPFFGHFDLSMTGTLSNVLEIPNTISDVFMADPISEANYTDKVNIWTNVQQRNAANFAPTVLLIHPNRTWKITAEQSLIRHLSDKTRIVPFEYFGEFWKARDATLFDFVESPDSVITVTIKNTSLPMHDDLSFIVDNGQSAKSIKVQDENGNPISFIKSNWSDNSIILHSSSFNETYDKFDYVNNLEISDFQLYPNPTTGSFTIEFDLMANSPVNFSLYDSRGALIDTPINKIFSIGQQSYLYESKTLASGIYYYRLSTNSSTRSGKILVTR